MNTLKAKKDCQHKMHGLEKKISQLRTHIDQVAEMIAEHQASMTSSPDLINYNLNSAREIERLKLIRSDYSHLMALKLQELGQMEKRLALIEQRMKEMNIKDEKQLEQQHLNQMIELSIMRQKK